MHVGDFEEILDNYRNYSFAEIFREIWTVATGRVTFSHCAFSVFEIHENFMKFDQNPPTREYAMFSYGKWSAFWSGIVKIAKVQPRGCFLALFRKSQKVLRL